MSLAALTAATRRRRRNPIAIALAQAADASNLLLDYADISTANWSTAGDAISLTAKASLVAGKTASLATQTAATAPTTRRLQTVSTFSGAAETAWAIVESADALAIGFAVYDSTASYLATADVIVATGALSAVIGTATAQLLATVGPNGGKVYKITLSYTGPAGHGRQVFFFPDGRGATTATGAIWHAGRLAVGNT